MPKLSVKREHIASININFAFYSTVIMATPHTKQSAKDWSPEHAFKDTAELDRITKANGFAPSVEWEVTALSHPDAKHPMGAVLGDDEGEISDNDIPYTSQFTYNDTFKAAFGLKSDSAKKEEKEQQPSTVDSHDAVHQYTYNDRFKSAFGLKSDVSEIEEGAEREINDGNRSRRVDGHDVTMARLSMAGLSRGVALLLQKPAMSQEDRKDLNELFHGSSQGSKDILNQVLEMKKELDEARLQVVEFRQLANERTEFGNDRTRVANDYAKELTASRDNIIWLQIIVAGLCCVVAVAIFTELTKENPITIYGYRGREMGCFMK